MLSEIEPLIAKGNYREAVARLHDVSDGLNGLPVAQKAKKKLVDLIEKPEVKKSLADADRADREADRNAKASAALAAAEQLEVDNKNELAYARFKSIVKEFQNTDAATTTAAEVSAIEKHHPEVIKKIADSANATKAKAALTLAASYKQSGQLEAAKSKYDSVLKDYPGTEFADQARKELAHLFD